MQTYHRNTPSSFVFPVVRDTHVLVVIYSGLSSKLHLCDPIADMTFFCQPAYTSRVFRIMAIPITKVINPMKKCQIPIQGRRKPIRNLLQKVPNDTIALLS